MKKITKDAESYRLAVYTFSMEYDAYPGDLEIATRYWGEADPNPATCYAMDKTDIAGTCNGNGNGLIADSGEEEEFYLAWQHLQKSGLISGTYSGTRDGSCPSAPNCDWAHTPGLNCPKSAVDNAAWALGYEGEKDGTEANPNWFVGQYGHTLLFGAPHPWNAGPNKPIITPVEAYSIDTKLDDGKPARGWVVVRTSDYNGLEKCTETTPGSGTNTTYDDLDAVYRVSVEEISCSLIFRNIL